MADSLLMPEAQGRRCVPVISALRRCRLEDQKFVILSCMPRSRLVWNIEVTIANLTTRQKKRKKKSSKS